MVKSLSVTPGSDSSEILQNFHIDHRKLRTIADIWLQLIIFFLNLKKITKKPVVLLPMTFCIVHHTTSDVYWPIFKI